MLKAKFPETSLLIISIDQSTNQSKLKSFNHQKQNIYKNYEIELQNWTETSNYVVLKKDPPHASQNDIYKTFSKTIQHIATFLLAKTEWSKVSGNRTFAQKFEKWEFVTSHILS